METLKQRLQREARELDVNRTIDNDGKVNHKTYCSIKLTDLDTLISHIISETLKEAVREAVRVIEGEKAVEEERERFKPFVLNINKYGSAMLYVDIKSFTGDNLEHFLHELYKTMYNSTITSDKTEV